MSDTRNIIKGRPDFEDHKFGITRAKRHPKYVYGTTQGLLIHEIAYVEMRWYEPCDGGENLRRLDRPHVSITTKCGQMFFAEYWRSKKRGPRSTMCELPKPDALLCGRCRGEGSVFGKEPKTELSKREAHALLGCAVGATEVQQ